MASGRSSYARGRATREQIIEAAVALFGEVGFHGASLRDIAARAGISHPGLLHHFPAKVDLLRAVLEHRDEADRADMLRDETNRRPLLETLVRLAERNQRSRRPVVELFAALSAEATSPDHPAHDYFVSRYERIVTMVRRELERVGAADGLRPGVEPGPAARGIVAFMDGLQIQWLYSVGRPAAEPLDMAAELRAHLNTILRDPVRSSHG